MAGARRAHGIEKLVKAIGVASTPCRRVCRHVYCPKAMPNSSCAAPLKLPSCNLRNVCILAGIAHWRGTRFVLAKHDARRRSMPRGAMPLSAFWRAVSRAPPSTVCGAYPSSRKSARKCHRRHTELPAAAHAASTMPMPAWHRRTVWHGRAVTWREEYLDLHWRGTTSTTPDVTAKRPRLVIGKNLALSAFRRQ